MRSPRRPRWSRTSATTSAPAITSSRMRTRRTMARGSQEDGADCNSGDLGANLYCRDERSPMSRAASPARALAVVSLGVLFASATWFSGTAAVPALGREWGLDPARQAWITVAVQLGFIAGTFLYSLLNLSDV